MASEAWFSQRRIISIILPLVAGIVSAFGLSSSVGLLRMIRPAGLDYQILVNLDHLNNQLRVTEKRLEVLESDLGQLKANPPGDEVRLQSRISDLEKNVSMLTDHQKIIDESLGNEAEKALSVPLLRQEVAGIKSSIKEHHAQLYGAVDRVYDLSKWLIGASFTSVLLLCVNSVIQGFKSPQKP